MDLRNLDIFSQSFTFKVSKSSGAYKTRLGGCLAILCYVLSIIGLFIFTSNYLNKTTPRVTISSESSNKYPRVKMLEHGFMMTISIAHGHSAISGSVELAQYGTFKIVKRRLSNSPQNPLDLNWEKVMSADIKECRNIETEKYDLDKILDAAKIRIYSELGLLFCPDIQEDDFWTIQGSTTQLPLEQVELLFYPCSLQDQTSCASHDWLVGATIKVSISMLTYNLADKDNPTMTLFEPEKISLKPLVNNYAEGSLNFKTVRVFDDTQNFAEAALNREFTAIDEYKSWIGTRPNHLHCTTESIENESCPPYIKINFISGPRIETVLRVYPKFFSTISEFGGFSNLIFIAVGFLYFFYNNFFYYQHLVKEISILKNDKKGTQKISLGHNGYSFDKKDLEIAEKKFIVEGITGVELMRSHQTVTTYLGASLGPYYSQVAFIIPLLEQAKRQATNPKTREDQAEAEEISPEIALKYVLEDEPDSEQKKNLRMRLIQALGEYEGAEGSRLMIEDFIRRDSKEEIPRPKKKILTKFRVVPSGKK